MTWERLKLDFEAWVLRGAAGAVVAMVTQYRPDSIVWEWTAFTGPEPATGISITPCVRYVFETAEAALAKAGV